MSGRTIDYSALPVLCEMYGVTDIETLLVQLVAIRDSDERNNHNHRA